MTIYQKAIKVRKTCEVQKDCRVCPYYGKCKTCTLFICTPVDEDIKDIARAIKEEKWIVK